MGGICENWIMAYLKRLDYKSATIDKSMMSSSNAGVENCNKKLHKIFWKTLRSSQENTFRRV